MLKKFPEIGKNFGPETIQILIDKIIGDLDTLRYLKSDSRLDETLPLIKRIFNSLDVLQFQLKDEMNGPQNIFQDRFWGQEYKSGLTMESLRNKITNIGMNLEEFVGPDLQLSDFAHFLDLFRSWISPKLSQWRQNFKTPRRRNLEFFLTCLSWSTIAICLVVMVGLGVVGRKWGLSAEFYNGINFDKEILSTHDKTINFVQALEMDPRIPSENFSARWQGTLLVPTDIEETFAVIVDDGVRLFIDEKILIDEWSDHDNGRFEKNIFLAKGKHKIRLEYYNHLHSCSLKLFWLNPANRTKQIIPAWNLRTDSL